MSNIHFNDESVAYMERPLDDMPEAMQSVYAYWRDIKGNRIAPTWAEFDMMKIPPSLLRSTLVKDVEQYPLAFRYRFYGTHFVRLWHREYTGKTTDEMESQILATAIRKSLEQYIEQKQPKFYLLGGKFAEKMKKFQIQLRLPLSDDGQTVTNIVTLVSHLIDKDAYTQSMLSDE